MTIEKQTISDVFLRNLKPSGKRSEITDTACTGHRVRISKEGKVTFILKVRDSGSRLQTITIGEYPKMSLKAARNEASRIKLDLKSGADPNAVKRARRQLVVPHPTLGELIIEFETFRAGARAVWSINGPRSTRSEARRCVELVFLKLLAREVTTLSDQDYAGALKSYLPARLTAGKKTSNGQASRARSYLMPALHWAAGRKGFVQAGAGRVPRLEVVDLVNVYDPSVNDISITGERDRVLTQDELQAVLPFLVYPAPRLPRLQLNSDLDFRPVAMRFLLFTAARREELEKMTWSEIDFSNGVWRKPSVKSTRGGPRGQSLPLSDAALAILMSLPAFGNAAASDFVFPNGTGGMLGNWTRFQNALMEATKTSGWHRHDLRRTAATLMHSLEMPISTIDQILGHTDPLRRENVSGAASHYLRLVTVMKNTENPQARALNVLANALSIIEKGIE